MNKKILLQIATVASLFTSSLNAHATGVQKLDVLGTCTTSTQKRNAQTALKWLEDFAAWRLREQGFVMSPQFIVWHSSLAGLAAAYKVHSPQDFAKLPFPDGRLTCSNYVNTLAFMAMANDTTKWVEKPNAVYCLDQEKVTVDISFSGYQVARDADGYIQYAVPFSAPATKLFGFDANGEMVLQVVGVDSRTSVAAREKLKQIMADDPNRQNVLPKDELSKGTFSSFRAKFSSEFGVSCR